MMFRSALNRIGAHSENTGMIGDRMDTDVVAGIEAGLHTVLVLTGISDLAEIERFPFRPDEILESVADLLSAEPDRDGPARDRHRRGPLTRWARWTTARRSWLADAATWRAWLEANHATSKGAWLVRPRPGSGLDLIEYEDAIRQALCFGWIDGPVRSFDEQTGGLWFAPRRPSSGWAATNKARLEILEREGLMAEAGIRAVELAKANGSWTILDNAEALREPDDLAAALDADARGPREVGRLPAVEPQVRHRRRRRGAAARDAGGAHREDRGGCRRGEAPA